MSILTSISAGCEHQTMTNAFYKTINTNGESLDDFSYNSYSDEVKLTALGYIGYTLRKSDRIGYTFFYSRQAVDTYQRREGKDAEDYPLVSSNNTTHIYSLQNHQFNGIHNFGEKDAWQLTWGTSWGSTGSNEPDRRQVMFTTNNGKLNFFTLNQPGNFALLWRTGRKRMERQLRVEMEME